MGGKLARWRLLLIPSLLAGASSAAHADVGLPMLALTWPGMFVALIPIVFVEAIVLDGALTIGFVPSLKVSARTNLISTIAGIPLAWLLMFVLEFVTGSSLGRWFDSVERQLPTSVADVLSVTLWSAWLGPREASAYWQVPAASLFLLLPTFLVSCWIEAQVAVTALANHEPTRVRAAVLRANIASYLLLAVLIGAWLTYCIVTR